MASFSLPCLSQTLAFYRVNYAQKNTRRNHAKPCTLGRHSSSSTLGFKYISFKFGWRALRIITSLHLHASCLASHRYFPQSRRYEQPRAIVQIQRVGHLLPEVAAAVACNSHKQGIIAKLGTKKRLTMLGINARSCGGTEAACGSIAIFVLCRVAICDIHPVAQCPCLVHKRLVQLLVHECKQRRLYGFDFFEFCSVSRLTGIFMPLQTMS